MAGQWPRLRKVDRQELTWLLVGLGACVLLLAFVTLAGEVGEGGTRAFDVRILRAFRSASDPAQPMGPAWVESAMLDLTALGGSTVLGLIVAAVVGFLALQARYHTAMVVAATSISGELLNRVMKNRFLRPRPDVVPHLRAVASSSFPSGHAMESAIIYLTLGAMLMRVAERRATKIYCLAWALVLTLLVGLSRVYLGVHYPTDVLAGWVMGFAWASICWLVAQRFEARTGAIGKEREKAK
jgi:undecaprenyl-diphosphatase